MHTLFLSLPLASLSPSAFPYPLSLSLSPGLLQVGDRIIEVNSESVDAMSPSELQNMLVGEPPTIHLKCCLCWEECRICFAEKQFWVSGDKSGTWVQGDSWSHWCEFLQQKLLSVGFWPIISLETVKKSILFLFCPFSTHRFSSRLNLTLTLGMTSSFPPTMLALPSRRETFWESSTKMTAFGGRCVVLTFILLNFLFTPSNNFRVPWRILKKIFQLLVLTFCTHRKYWLKICKQKFGNQKI